MHRALWLFWLEDMAGAEGLCHSFRQGAWPHDIRHVGPFARGAYVGSPGRQPGPGQQDVAAARLQVDRCVGCQLCQQALLCSRLLSQMLHMPDIVCQPPINGIMSLLCSWQLHALHWHLHGLCLACIRTGFWGYNAHHILSM